MTEPPDASPSSKPAEPASSAPPPAVPVEGVWGAAIGLTFVNLIFGFFMLGSLPTFVFPSILVAEIVFGLLSRTSPRSSKILLFAALMTVAIAVAFFAVLSSICGGKDL